MGRLPCWLSACLTGCLGEQQGGHTAQHRCQADSAKPFANAAAGSAAPAYGASATPGPLGLAQVRLGFLRIHHPSNLSSQLVKKIPFGNHAVRYARYVCVLGR